MKQIDKVYEYVVKKVSRDIIIDNFTKDKEVGVDAYEIEQNLGIVRNNASTLLNNLYNINKLIKIKGRPVRFIPRVIFEDSLHVGEMESEYDYDELRRLVLQSESEKELEDPFKVLIGYDKSLRNQIEQAKAAIMYPPNGLHTLIVGQTGVGKTMFANVMYEYARLKRGKDEDEFPFVSFNCADYYNNPQLLLSQLFGHVKGSFTGADSDKFGLVDKADGGILFLDEVHRLPPDGQEMLFFLMDKGEYYRLGEASKPRKSNLLIIAATTEDPQKFLLRTFLRRIPVIITLPSLKEKSVEEKVELVQELFVQEALRIDKSIIICPEVLKALVLYDCKGNIGQLKSDIRLLCAKSFLRHLQNNEDLKIEFSMLPKDAKDAVFKTSELDSNIQKYLNVFNDDIIIYPNKSKGKTVKYTNRSIYDIIYDELNDLKRKGMSYEKIEEIITEKMEQYFESFLNTINSNKFNIRELYKLLDIEIVDFTYELITYASEVLGTEFDNKILFVLAFHINALIERVKNNKPVINHEVSTIKKSYPKEYEVASVIVEKISDKFELEIPSDEKGFIAILLANNKQKKKERDKIGILVIAHGDSTASSIANVCNRLLNSDDVKAIDMPLEESVDKTYTKALTTVKAIDKGKGVILLVDMGSLKDFGDKITEETGIITKTIANVSTPLVLEVARRVAYKEESIDEIYNSLVNNSELEGKYNKKAIITVCATGKGTSILLARMLNDILGELKQEINIFSFNYSDIQNNTEDFINIKEKYDIIACVGNIQPDIDVPYFSLDELFDETSKKNFYQFIKSQNPNVKEGESIYNRAQSILQDFCLFVNPKKVVEYIRNVIDILIDTGEFSYYFKDESATLNLVIHIGIMVERIIKGQKVKFEKVKEYKKIYINEFLIIKDALEVIEGVYDKQISDDEICYILKILHTTKD
ncbi:sigma 54-interacting transcriptional regulator [Tepidimicrobium xylanilyticum]|uniref:sigma 54-interacting transcriptional regulator n=1 Tax=Tepidimicrobium xylanilyticum TaxID=1123352 RepID=UPI002652F2A8|nr:sigma-54-dependent transcriptional regulator [Tepidimicrobium xylanilyticum]GMG95337.1 transcriptional regulator [Tepidimicrobium xylanilyticum]